jgi:hypothetical protein
MGLRTTLSDHNRRIRMTQLNRSALLAALVLAVPAAASAQVAPLDRVSVSVAAAFPDNSIDFNFESNSSNESVDFESDLGLDTNNLIAQVGATWRPWENHQFGLTYFGNSTDNTRTLDEPIEWNGVVYDGTVKSELDFAAYDISYIWWAKNEQSYALGPMFRLTYITIDSKIDLTIDADGEPVVDDSFKRSGNTDIPAPTIGGAWRWVPAANWRINAEAGYMQANFSDFDGSALVASGGVTWFPWENWGIGVNGIYIDFDVDTDNDDFRGDLSASQWNYNLAFTYRF